VAIEAGGGGAELVAGGRGGPLSWQVVVGGRGGRKRAQLQVQAGCSLLLIRFNTEIEESAEEIVEPRINTDFGACAFLNRWELRKRRGW
jgi:hypothetical protein